MKCPNITLKKAIASYTTTADNHRVTSMSVTIIKARHDTKHVSTPAKRLVEIVTISIHNQLHHLRLGSALPPLFSEVGVGGPGTSVGNLVDRGCNKDRSNFDIFDPRGADVRELFSGVNRSSTNLTLRDGEVSRVGGLDACNLISFNRWLTAADSDIRSLDWLAREARDRGCILTGNETES